MSARLDLCWLASAPADTATPAASFAARVVPLVRFLVIAWTRWRSRMPQAARGVAHPAHALMVETARSTMGSFHL